MIVKLYAQRILDGKMVYADVPRLLKEQVAEILRANGKEELIDVLY